MTRRFLINIHCASCSEKIIKAFKKMPNINIDINIMEKIMNVDASEQEYSDEEIINILKKIGYKAEML